MNTTNLIYLCPEIFLLVATSIILLIDMFLSDRKRIITYLLSLLALVICALFTFKNYNNNITTIYAFNNMFVINSLTSFLKLLVYLVISVGLIYSRKYNNNYLGGKFYVLVLFSVLGQMIMISSNSFLSMYLGLELMSLSLYALVALCHDYISSTEAAIKYFSLGALASGFLLYGISMLYGATNSLEINEIFRFIGTDLINHQILVFGIVFIIAGLAFKLGLVPFHMWIPDVYQGAPTQITLLLSGAPKLAIFAIMFHSLSEGLLLLAGDWQQMLMILAVFSIITGNIAAIAQTNIKRMLAYSTISHMGFMLLGMLSGVINNNLYQSVYAYSSSLFYLVSYVITTLGIFGVILLISNSNSLTIENLQDFKGLNKRSPWIAIIMFVLMFSMTGIPPTMGFYAKFYVLQATLNAGHIWLLTIVIIFSVIGAFYYLRIIKLMYFDDPINNEKITISFDARLILTVNALIILFIGIWPTYLIKVSTITVLSTLSNFLNKVIVT